MNKLYKEINNNNKNKKKKQKAYVNKLEDLNLTNIIIPISWTLNEKENVIIDFEGMKQEFENKLREFRDNLD